MPEVAHALKALRSEATLAFFDTIIMSYDEIRIEDARYGVTVKVASHSADAGSS